MTADPLIANIRAELKRQRMTQRGLATAIGVKESLLSKTLNGRREMRVSELDAIANVLHVPVDTLLHGSDSAVSLVSRTT